ncbi:urease accessory protein UreD [Ferviditalea candida]|uniref:Urease accessory protein UreD n=1 Tax=Ferviditalea candida TaxID=3108399 RepID=A0ABU5ZNB2_9BACL|nr:urease accessory protein UreD [Paenibacillaceae bacterium T2]
MKISKTHRIEDSDQLYVCIMDASPGMLEGDHYQIEMKLEPESKVFLTNQASTKLHPARHEGALLNQTFYVDERSLLEYFPEPIVPFASSKTEMNTVFHLGPQAVLFYADIITPGRLHRDEKFLYQSLRMNTEIYREGRLAVWDHFYLEPMIHRYHSTGAFEEYTHLGTFWLCSEHDGEHLLKRIRELFPAHSKVLMGTSLTAERDIHVRMLGHSVWELQSAIREIWKLSRLHLLNSQPLLIRK